MPHQLVTHLDQDWLRHVADVREAAARLWAIPSRHYTIGHGPSKTKMTGTAWQMH